LSQAADHGHHQAVLDGRRTSSVNYACGVGEYVEIVDDTTPRVIRQTGVFDRRIERKFSYQRSAEDTAVEE
jgi:hypothetical protein